MTTSVMRWGLHFGSSTSPELEEENLVYTKIQGSDFHLMKVLHFVVFWALTPCSLVGCYQCFEGTSCFSLFLWRHYVPLDPCHLPVRLYDIIPVNYSTSCLHVRVSFFWSYWFHSCSTCILWSPKVHSCVHRSLLCALIL